MNIAFTNISSNLGLSFEFIVVLLFLFGGIIFMSRNFKLGLVMYFIGAGGLFMWFYQMDLNWAIPLIIFFISLILMAFTFYAVSKQVASQGFI